MSDQFQSEAERLSEQFRTLMENRKVLDWWQKQLDEVRIGYQGVSHALNKAIAEAVTSRHALLKEYQELKDRCEKLESEREEANATIGQLQSDLLAVLERLERIAEWANKQKGIEK